MKASQLKNVALATLFATASKVFGIGLWDKQTKIAEGKVANDYDKPLDEDTDPRKLKGPAMYWVKGKFGTQMLLKYADGGWTYAAPVTDKEREPVLSDENQYQIFEVVARNRFEVKDDAGQPVLNEKGDAVVIEKGFTTCKAYAL